jgi:hypothetical protein
MITSFIKERLAEPSTFRGIILILGLLGIKISPELTDSIYSLVVAGLATVEVLRKEKKSTEAKLAEVKDVNSEGN